MANALEDFVNPRDLGRNFIREIGNGHAALASLVTVRQNVVDMLAVVQADTNIPAAARAGANEMGAALRQAILNFAGTL